MGIHALMPVFREQGINVEALSALYKDDIKELIPKTGPRALFIRCWEPWAREFNPKTVSLSDLEAINISIEKNNGNFVIVPQTEKEVLVEESYQDTVEEPNQIKSVSVVESVNEPPSTSSPPVSKKPATASPVTNRQCIILQNLLKESVETSFLLNFHDHLDGDSARNLLASVIAKDIIKKNLNSPIRGDVYFSWAKAMRAYTQVNEQQHIMSQLAQQQAEQYFRLVENLFIRHHKTGPHLR